VVAIHSCSDHTVYAIPALETESAVQAILDALVAEADQEMSEVGEDLSSAGKRALGTRKARCDEMRKKLETYASLLGPRLDTIRDKLEDAKGSVVEAMLLAESRAESKAV